MEKLLSEVVEASGFKIFPTGIVHMKPTKDGNFRFFPWKKIKGILHLPDDVVSLELWSQSEPFNASVPKGAEHLVFSYLAAAYIKHLEDEK